MATMIDDDLGRIPMSPYLTATLTRAADYATAQSHREVTLEHLLLALAEDPEASIVLKSSDVDIARLLSDVSGFLGRSEDRIPPGTGTSVVISQDLKRILEAAAAAAQQGRRREINGAIVLAAIVGDGKSAAANLLRAQGLTFEAAIRALQKASASQALAGQAAAAPPPTAPSAPTSTDDILAAARERVQNRSGRGESVFGTRAASDESPQPAAKKSEAPEFAHPSDDADQRGLSTLSTKADREPEPIAPLPAPPEPTEEAWRPPASAPAPALPPAPAPAAARPAIPQPTVGPPLPSEGAPTFDFPRAQPSPPGRQWAPPPAQPAPPEPQLPMPAGLGAPPPPPPPAQPMPSMPRRPMGVGAGSAPPPVPPTPGFPPTQGGGQPSLPRLKDYMLRPEPAAGAPDIGAAEARAPMRRQDASAPERRRAGSGGFVGSWPLVESGQLVENIPRRMRAGVPVVVEARVAKADVKALAEGLQGGGAAYRHEIVVTKAMSVRLRAPDGGFWIETRSPETQWIENVLGLSSDDYASWRWTVTPRERGRRQLQLIVSARTVGADGMTAETALPDQVIDVRVGINYGRTFGKWIGWVAAAVIGGLLARFGEGAFEQGREIIARLTSG